MTHQEIIVTNYPPHFSRAEMLFSETAMRNNIDNEPENEQIESNIIRTAWQLELLRENIDQPIIINSGYRSPYLNNAVGGSKTSAHMRGLAADIRAIYLTPLELAKKAAEVLQDYDQIIHEFGRWVHIGFSDSAPRGELLTAMKENKKTVYKHGLIEV